jgi:hypothetical protein
MNNEQIIDYAYTRDKVVGTFKLADDNRSLFAGKEIKNKRP